jgi:hypothetical protein
MYAALPAVVLRSGFNAHEIFTIAMLCRRSRVGCDTKFRKRHACCYSNQGGNQIRCSNFADASTIVSA